MGLKLNNAKLKWGKIETKLRDESDGKSHLGIKTYGKWNRNEGGIKFKKNEIKMEKTRK